MVVDEELTGEITKPSDSDEDFNSILEDLKMLGFDVKRDIKYVKHYNCEKQVTKIVDEIFSGGGSGSCINPHTEICLELADVLPSNYDSAIIAAS